MAELVGYKLSSRFYKLTNYKALAPISHNYPSIYPIHKNIECLAISSHPRRSIPPRIYLSYRFWYFKCDVYTRTHRKCSLRTLPPEQWGWWGDHSVR